MESGKEKINKFLLNPSFRNWALNRNIKDFEEWENILNNDSELRILAHEAKKVVIKVELSDQEKSTKDHQSFERLLIKQKNSIRSASVIEPSIALKSPNSIFTSFIKIAAVLSFIIAFSGLFYINVFQKENEPLPVVVEILKKQTQNGFKLTVTLPDGSKVKLNSNSTISYPKNFFNNRSVTLEGEAFFNVVRDESNPFIVKTNNFQTEVLGTSFNVKANSWSDPKVSVAEGKVKVRAFSSDQGHKILLAKEAIEIIDNELREADFHEDEILWKDGYLVFSDENIESISAKIQQWFDVKVIVKNQFAIRDHYSGTYSNESLEEILVGMGFALNFSFEMKENQIFINGNNN